MTRDSIESFAVQSRGALLGTVTRIHVCAIKGFSATQVDMARVTPSGIAGDREFAVVDRSGKLFSVTRSGFFLRYWSDFDEEAQTLSVSDETGATHRDQVGVEEATTIHLSGGRAVTGRFVQPAWDQVISTIAGRAVRLVHIDRGQRAYDLHPITMVGEASVRALGDEQDGTTLDARRFRMSLDLDAGQSPFAEDGWQGIEARLGTGAIVVGGPVPRCAAVQHDPRGGGNGPNVLRRINDLRGVQHTELGKGLPLGVYAQVATAGVVRVGDAVVAPSGFPTRQEDEQR
jgi:uncharacterized protein YcbX